MRSAQCYRRCRGTRATTKVRIVSGRMQNPVAPADFRKRNIQLLATALGHTSRTVQTSLLPTNTTVGEGVDHNKRSVVAVQRQQIKGRIWVACVARDLDDVRKVVLRNPGAHTVRDVDFHPRLWIFISKKDKLILQIRTVVWCEHLPVAFVSWIAKGLTTRLDFHVFTSLMRKLTSVSVICGCLYTQSWALSMSSDSMSAGMVIEKHMVDPRAMASSQ